MALKRVAVRYWCATKQPVRERCAVWQAAVLKGMEMEPAPGPCPVSQVLLPMLSMGSVGKAEWKSREEVRRCARSAADQAG